MGIEQIRIRVSVCLVDTDGRILLVQHRKAERRYWLLPGGGVEVGETLVTAARREVREETGLTAQIDRLVLICEAIEPQGRHILNVVFAGRIAGGRLDVEIDERLIGADWHPVEALLSLETYPPIGEHIVACWRNGFAGDVVVLGNVWEDHRAADDGAM